MILIVCLMIALVCTVVNAYEGNRKLTWFGFAIVCGILVSLALTGGQRTPLP